jgi:hypothetical protein
MADEKPLLDGLCAVVRFFPCEHEALTCSLRRLNGYLLMHAPQVGRAGNAALSLFECKDGAKVVAGRVDMKPVEAIP